MAVVSPNNQNFIEFDGIRLDAKYILLICYLKSNGITKLDQIRNKSLYSDVVEKGLCPTNDVKSFLREFRMLTEDPGNGITLVGKSDDALGKIVPVYKFFKDPLRTACSLHNVKTLFDLLTISKIDLVRIYTGSKEIEKFVETVHVLPITGLKISDTSINILHQNGIQTVEQLALTGHAFLSQLLGMTGSLMNEILDSFSYLSESVEKYRKLKMVGKTPPPKTTFEFDNTGYILYVYKGKLACKYHNHEVVWATGVLASLEGTPKFLKIEHCENCDKCFIEFSDYKKYREKYGILLGNISFDEDIFPKGKKFANLSEESPLRLCGYTVRKEANLSERDRRRILGSIMDHNILNRAEIIDYLKFFINYGKNNPIMKNAVQKWSDDLEWVSGFQIDTSRHYLITGVRKFN